VVIEQVRFLLNSPVIAQAKLTERENKMANKRIYIQGDILFLKVDKLPSVEKEIADGVVARGEATGHTHKVDKPGKVFTNGQEMYVAALNAVKVLHEEHGMIELPAGDYQVVRQREWLPEGFRKVAD